jgi:hypothetical protein
MNHEETKPTEAEQQLDEFIITIVVAVLAIQIFRILGA